MCFNFHDFRYCIQQKTKCSATSSSCSQCFYGFYFFYLILLLFPIFLLCLFVSSKSLQASVLLHYCDTIQPLLSRLYNRSLNHQIHHNAANRSPRRRSHATCGGIRPPQRRPRPDFHGKTNNLPKHASQQVIYYQLLNIFALINFPQSMKMEPSFFKKLVVPAAVLPFLAPMAAFAAEGTGRVSFLHTSWH